MSFTHLQSLECLSYSNIRALAGDFPSAHTGCRWSNLRDEPGGNTWDLSPSAQRGL